MNSFVEIARRIMGINFLGTEEVTKHFGVHFTCEQLVEFQMIPFTESELEGCKNTHVLMAGYPLTVLGIKSRVPNYFFYPHGNAWYINDRLAKETIVDLRWYLLRKDLIPGSVGATHDEQEKLLNNNERVPYACEIIYLVTLYRLATGICLTFQDSGVRCLDILYCRGPLERGDRVYMKSSTSIGIDLQCYDDIRHGDTGIISSSQRKLFK